MRRLRPMPPRRAGKGYAGEGEVIDTLLEIRDVHVLSGEGQTFDLRRVSCPVHGRSVIVDECLACAESGGLERDPVGRLAYASCRHAGAGTEARREGASGDPTPVSAVMTTDVMAVRPDVSLEALTDLMLQRGFGGMPVVDEAGRPLGVVSKTDLIERRFVAGDTAEAPAPGWHAGRGHYRVQPGPGVHAEAPGYESVGDAMSRTAQTISENAPVEAAAALMATRGIHRVLVVSDDGRLTGIVTSTDIMRWVAGRAGQLH